MSRISEEPTKTTLPATSSEMSPFRRAADEELAGSFAGELLKFSKGVWLLGKDAKPVPDGEHLAAVMDEYWRGWTRWRDSVATDHRIGRVIDDFVVAPRQQLGDLDESQWEEEPNGLRRDPWVRTSLLVLRRLDDGELVTFTSSSDGGRKAVAKLADQYDRQRRKHPGASPIVALCSESYVHKLYGRIAKPAFPIVDWEKNESVGEAQHQADALNDAVPF